MSLYKTIQRKDKDTAGIIPVFVVEHKEPRHSYSLSFDNKTAVRVAEKDPELVAQGAYANIGAYYFSTGKIFVDEAETAIQEGDVSGLPGKEEFFVAPLYQRLLNQGKKVQIAIVKEVWRLGTPQELEDFEKNYQV